MVSKKSKDSIFKQRQKTGVCKRQWKERIRSVKMTKNQPTGASLVVQWLRVCLPLQGTRVWALVRKDPTCRRAARPVCHNCWACTLEPMSHNYWAHVSQLLKPVRLEPVLCNGRSHCNETPAHHNEEGPQLTATRESPHSNGDPT